MNTIKFCLCAGFVLGMMITEPLQSASSQKNSQPASTAASKRQAEVLEEENEYDILERNEIDDSDVLAIPFDDSEVEDEEEVNRIEGRDLFKLPQPPK